MKTRRDPDRMVHAFLQDGADQLSDQVYDAVRAEIDHKRQRVVIGPWRLPTLNTYTKPVAAAVAVIAIGALGLATLRPGTSPGVGGGSTPSPSISPPPSASPTAPPSASPSAAPSAPALTQTFTSQRNGFSVMYPTGWETQRATTAWTTGVPDFVSSAGDVFFDPARQRGNLWISISSQPIGDSTPDEWAADTIALDDGCRETDPITVDGAAGLVGADECTRAAVTIDGRGYSFWLYTSADEIAIAGVYDRAWFEELLSTVQLLPADAVDAASSAAP